MPTRFRAFLSYSHADAEWARWLLRRLETYRVPSRLVGTHGAHGEIGARLGTFFRDRDELPSSGDLGTTIREALAESAALIVVCSPAAAQSRWVSAEVEAFRASGSGDRVLCFVVAGEPGSTDPAQQCFPPALLAAASDGRAIEPLAADARREGDGRERAFLKLVAGLLGVGYDTLAQREAQRRQRKWAMAAAASLAGMAIALGLALTAWVARNDAQRRQAQAEDILGFMLGDLRRKLTTAGRLDLMRAVDDKATVYFATLDPRDLSDRALEEQARSLTGIGEVRLDEGNHDAAMSAFREAHARSTALHKRAPADGQRLFDLAQAEYWIGYVALEQGRYDDADLWFRKYRDSGVRLAAMDRSNFQWQREAGYGYHNLATLDERRGRYADAEQAMRAELALLQQWMRQRPNDMAIRSSIADALSWLGTLAARQGQLADAEGLFQQQAGVLQQSIALDPRNAQWREEHVNALLLLAEVQAQRGRLEAAEASIRTVMPMADALVRQDPTNNDWQVAPGIVRWWQGQLGAAARAPSAAEAANAAAVQFARVHASEPQDDRVARWLAKARNLQAQLALARGDAEAAQVYASDARTLLAPAWQAKPSEALRVLFADNRLVSGEIALAEGDRDRALADWHQSETLLLAKADGPLPFGRLDSLVRVLMHLDRGDEARPHQERLAAGGYVPLRPFPAAAGPLAAQ
jgi:hypothetical protein